jgi:hypothetical protein
MRLFVANSLRYCVTRLMQYENSVLRETDLSPAVFLTHIVELRIGDYGDITGLSVSPVATQRKI